MLFLPPDEVDKLQAVGLDAQTIQKLQTKGEFTARGQSSGKLKLSMSGYPENSFDRYHAHIYFDEENEAQARSLCIEAWQQCHVGLGRFHRKPVGPHPLWSCQLSFDADEFDRLIPWLDANRSGLDILIHPLTGDALAEHTEHARWLGNEVALRVEIFAER